jgi:hypothetical protein
MSMNRLLVVRCPHLLDEDEGGSTLRSFIEVIDAVEAFCPWVTAVRAGICSLPARGPARYFGGEVPLVQQVADTVSSITPVEVGVADGLFAAVLAARGNVIVPADETPDFLASFPVEILGRPELTDLLNRLGIRTLGDLSALPESHVLGRFGSDGVICHRVAGGRTGELGDLRQTSIERRIDLLRRGPGPDGVAGDPQFWGGTSDIDRRAGRALTVVQDLLGPDGVLSPHLQGGRGPAQRARFVPWNAPESQGAIDVGPPLGAPWPGQIPPPAPMIVHPSPLHAEIVDVDDRPVSVSGRGLLTATPCRLSVEKSPWSTVAAWAGPWPSDERWWSRTRRRSARMQAVAGTEAHLLLVERGRWWVEATYG